MFKTRDHPSDLCQRPLVLFLDSVTDDANGVWTNYTRYNGGDCSRRKGVERLKVVSVYSVNLGDDFEEVLLMLFVLISLISYCFVTNIFPSILDGGTTASLL